MKAFSTILVLFFTVLTIFSCGGKSTSDTDLQAVRTQRLPGDSTIYGLACDGCTDSVVVLLPEDGSDPVTYDIIDAKRRGRVLGKIQVGDKIGIIRNKHSKSVADEVIDIDKMEGIWCYIVMPKLKGSEEMSRWLQNRMLDKMSDSLKETFLIPREYGFWLRREWEASSVGYIAEVNSLADESPVIYPPLGYFTNWHIWNGKFIMTMGTPKLSKNNQLTVTNLKYDTCTIDYLGADSLVLSDADGSRSYYRKNDINDVNKRAKAIAEMRSKEALEQTKSSQQ